MIRIIVAAIVGGIVMFGWGAFSHMVLPFAEAGIKSVPNEAAVTSALETNMKESGFYFVPGMANLHNPTEQDQAEWTAKYEKGPNAIIVYHPIGRQAFSPALFGRELASNMIAALFVALILSWSTASYVKRVGIAALVGAAGWASISLSQWNWYRFPMDVTLAEGFDQIVGWLVTGIVMALIVKPRGE